MKWPVKVTLAIHCVFALVAACAEHAVPPAAADTNGVLLWVPLHDSGQEPRRLLARLCRPVQPGPRPLAIVAHGSAEDPASMRPADCASEPARWFLARGYAVLFPLRRGYGSSSGPMAEGSGPCDRPDYLRAGLESARDLAAAVAYGRALPGIAPNGMVLVGQSLGGWAVLAYAATVPDTGMSLVVMAGGRGGHAFGDAPGDSARNCRADLLVAAAGAFGRTARTPMLWVYASNDSYFPPALAQAMHAAFVAAGGTATLVQPAFGREGHALFNGPGGSRIWGPAVEAYLASRSRTTAP